jgi:hypothetical protein
VEQAVDKHLSVKEFRSAGYHQELNRQFLHPLGLALFVTVDADGAETFGPIVDNRDDPEGMEFAKFALDSDKALRVEDEQQRRAAIRTAALGYNVQPITPVSASNKIAAKLLRLLAAVVYGLGTMAIMLIGWAQIINLVDHHTAGGLLFLFAVAHAVVTIDFALTRVERPRRHNRHRGGRERGK